MQTPANIQHAWDQIADGYDANITEKNLTLGAHVIDRVPVESDMAFLDVAAGAGALSIHAARLGAQVTAIDIAPSMIEHLRQRARSEGLTNIKGIVMDGSALEFEDDHFDVVGSLLGVMVFPNMRQGLSEMARVTKPGGKVLVVGFGRPEEVEFIGLALKTIEQVAPHLPKMPVDPPPPPFQLAAVDYMRESLESVGLGEIEVETITWSVEFTSADDWIQSLANSNPIGAQLVGQLNGEDLKSVHAAFGRLLQERSQDGVTNLTAQINVGTGTKPA